MKAGSGVKIHQFVSTQKFSYSVMPVPDQVRDDRGACPAQRCGGIQKPLKRLDSPQTSAGNDGAIHDAISKWTLL